MTCPRHGLLTTPSPEGPAGGFKTSRTFSDAGLSGWSFVPCPLGWVALGNSLLAGCVLPCHVGLLSLGHRKHRGFPLGRTALGEAGSPVLGTLLQHRRP